MHVQHAFSFNVVIKQPYKHCNHKGSVSRGKADVESEFYLTVDFDSSGVVMQWKKTSGITLRQFPINLAEVTRLLPISGNPSYRQTHWGKSGKR